MSEDDSTGTDKSGFWRIVHIGVRVAQFALGALAVIFVLGALIGGMNVIQFMAVGLMSLLLLVGVGVLELLAARPAQRRSGRSS